MQSPFLNPGATTQVNHLASLHLSRDSLLPVKLATVPTNAEDSGYAEGVVTNTKFGSFPHSTLIGVPWGCQVLASKVDTGTRGRVDPRSRKRKAKEISTDSPADKDDDAGSPGLKQATAATSGFIHVLPPTPESWTTSLPHRTQVVYTPDYSYILQRIRARPGSALIEAGSGSGSFTHAAARAVFQGTASDQDATSKKDILESVGKVFSYEFHAERHERVKTEMVEHGLDSIVTATHRDVYKDGFLLDASSSTIQSPHANAIFLDLPAPWEALPHLTRRSPNKPSALDPQSAVYICSFSPCIEQVQKTVSTLRRHGWIDVEMVDIQHKRIDVKREYTGLKYEGMRGVNAVASNVDEAMERLVQVETNAKEHQPRTKNSNERRDRQQRGEQVSAKVSNNQDGPAQKHFDEGRLMHRAEPELKTHTSYLVFALLPREWTDEDEEAARKNAPPSQEAVKHGSKSGKQLKREAKQKKAAPNGE